MIPTVETSSSSRIPPQRDTSLYGLGPDDRLIKLAKVKALTGYGATSIYAKIKLGAFPKPVKPCAADSSRWVLGEIRKFNADAIAARDREADACASNGTLDLIPPLVDGRTHQRHQRSARKLNNRNLPTN